MGAPGMAWFCRRGHLYSWLDEHLYWGESVYELDQAAREGCPCGEKVVTSISHYGDVNDCQPPHRQLTRMKSARISRTERIQGAHDGQGHPVTAYVDRVRELPRYNVSSLVFERS